MIKKKSDKEIALLREGGKRLVHVLERLVEHALPGVTTEELNTRALEYFRESGGTPAFLNYTPSGANRPYPGAICTSINHEIVHGIPNEDPQTLQDGDLISFDTGLVYEELITDTAWTVGVGEIDEKARELLRVTRTSLDKGVSTVRAGACVGDIGEAIETYVAAESTFSIFRELVGHGVGYELHEEPYIPNVGRKGEGPVLESGTVVAIEPMLGEGDEEIVLLPDGYTYATKDGSRSAHFEHTVVVTDEGAEVLTENNL